MTLPDQGETESTKKSLESNQAAGHLEEKLAEQVAAKPADQVTAKLAEKLVKELSEWLA